MLLALLAELLLARLREPEPALLLAELDLDDDPEELPSPLDVDARLPDRAAGFFLAAGALS